MKRLITIIFALIGFYSFGQVTYVGSATSAQIGGLNVPSGRSALVYDSTIGQYGFENSASLWYWLITEADIDTFAELDAIVADKTIVNTADSQTLTNKTISGASNTLSGIPTTALSNGDKGAITVTSGILTIDTGAVTTSQILDGTIGGVDISDGAVGGAAVLDGSLTGADIADGFIAEVDLNASVNASLDLADSAVQPGDNISTLTNDAGYITSQTDDQTAAEVSVSATPSNYTAATADVEAHLAGIDTALGSVGGGSGDVVGPTSSTDTDVALFNGTTGKLIKTSGGNLTYNGNGTLVIKSTGAATIEAQFDLNSNNGGQVFRFFARDSDNVFGMYDFTRSNTWLRYTSNTTAATTKLALLENGGNVGIGTNSPSAKLDVNGNLAVTGNIASTGDLTVTGGDINSATSIDINLDTDNNGTEAFNIKDGAGTTVFSVSEGGVVTGVDANEVVYDNVDSGLAATNVKAAIDEVVNDLQAQDAANEITYSNTTSGLSATNVQAAIDEVVAEINSNPINFVYNSGTGAYTVTTETTDDLIIIDRAADSNVLLPASPSAGASYTFQQAGAGKLQFPTSEYVTGTTLRTTGEGKVAQYLWDNTNSRWIAIGGLESYTPAGAPTIDGFESTATAGEVSSVAVNKPAAAASGKFAFILVWIEQTNLDTYFDNSTNKPTGFTQIGTQWGDINSDVFQAAYYKELDGTEGSSFTIPTPGTYTGNMGAVCFIVDGVNAANPIGQVGTAATDADYTPNPPIAGAVTTATNNELAIAFVGLDGSDLGAITGSGTGWTTQGTINDGQNSATGLSGIWAAAEIATAGTSNSYTVSTTSVDGYTAVQFTIRSE